MPVHLLLLPLLTISPSVPPASTTTAGRGAQGQLPLQPCAAQPRPPAAAGPGDAGGVGCRRGGGGGRGWVWRTACSVQRDGKELQKNRSRMQLRRQPFDVLCLCPLPSAPHRPGACPRPTRWRCLSCSSRCVCGGGGSVGGGGGSVPAVYTHCLHMDCCQSAAACCRPAAAVVLILSLLLLPRLAVCVCRPTRAPTTT